MRHMLQRMARLGLAGFYYGVVAAATRCTFQTFCSYHLFHNLHELLQIHPIFLLLKPYDTEPLKALCSLLTGIAATPVAKVSVIRQADLTRGAFERRNYGALTSGMKCMFRRGGLKYLFIGWKMNAVNSAMTTGLFKPVSSYVEGLLPLAYKTEDSWVPNLARMALTGSIINVIMTPIDTVSIMALNHTRYSDFTYGNLCRLVMRKHGYRGFFFGLKPGLISLIPNTVLLTVAARLLHDPKPPETPPDKTATSSQPTGR